MAKRTRKSTMAHHKRTKRVDKLLQRLARKPVTRWTSADHHAYNKAQIHKYIIPGN